MPKGHPKVFLIQQPKPRSGDHWMPDFSSAAKYGALDYVFGKDESAFSDPDRALQLAEVKLSDFDPSCDYLLWLNFGDPACLFIVIQLLTAMGHWSLNYLYWSRGVKPGVGYVPERGYYLPVTVTIPSNRLHAL